MAITLDPGSYQAPVGPVQSGVAASPVSTPGAGLVIDPGSYQPPIDHGAGTAFGRGVVTGGTFGAGSFLSAAIDSAAQKLLPQRALNYLQQSQPSDIAPINQDIPFAQRRAAYNTATAATQQQHPYAFGAGEAAGAIAVPAPGAGAAARAAEKAVASRVGTGLASRVATKAAGAAAGGAVIGGQFAAGTGLSQGQSAAELAKSTLLGSGVGAVTGPAAALASHGISAAVSKAQQSLADKYTQVFGSEVFGHASKRATTNSWAQILGKEAETGVEQDAAKKFVQSAELAPVETAARKGKYAEAIEEIDKKLEQYRPGRQQNYGQVEAASKFEVGKGLDELDTALFRSRNATKNPQATQALEKARQDWVQDFSSADSGAVQRALLRPEGVESTEVADQLRAITDHLPQSGRISRTQFADAVKETNAGPEAVRYLDQHILDPKAGLLSWDPKATIPALELRAQATARQQSALQAFDKLNPNLSVETKTAVKKAIVSGLEKHLDSAAATSPAAAQAVRRIRQDDVRFSVLLAAKQGLSEAVEKQQRSEFKPLTSLGKLLHTGVGLGVTAPIAYAQGKKASHELEQGNLPGALEHGAFALGAGALAGRALGQKLSILANRAQNSQAAQKLYQAIQARMSHGPIGVATSTTLGQQQAQQQPQAQPQQGAPQ